MLCFLPLFQRLVRTHFIREFLSCSFFSFFTSLPCFFETKSLPHCVHTRLIGFVFCGFERPFRKLHQQTVVYIHVNVREIGTWRVDGAKTDWDDRALDFLQSIGDYLFLLEIRYVMRRSTLANHVVAVSEIPKSAWRWHRGLPECLKIRCLCSWTFESAPEGVRGVAQR